MGFGSATLISYTFYAKRSIFLNPLIIKLLFHMSLSMLPSLSQFASQCHFKTCVLRSKSIRRKV